MKSRRERRAEAKRNKVKFKPQYNSDTRVDTEGNKIKFGGEPQTYQEMFGVGYERFNNKFVTIKELDE